MRRRAAFLLIALLVSLPARQLRADAGDDQYAVAAAHYSAQRWSLAVDEFRSLLKDHPEHRSATKSRFFLAEALMQMGRYDEAQAQFRDFLSHDPKSPFAVASVVSRRRGGVSGRPLRRGPAGVSRISRQISRRQTQCLRPQLPRATGARRWRSRRGRRVVQPIARKISHRAAARRMPFRLGPCPRIGWPGRRSGKALSSNGRRRGCRVGRAIACCDLATLQVGSGQRGSRGGDVRGIRKEVPKEPRFRRKHGSSTRGPCIKGAISTRRSAILEPIVADGKSSAGSAPSNSARYLLALTYQGSKRRPDALKLLDAMEPSANAAWKPKIELARAASLIATEQFARRRRALEAYLQTKPGDEYAARAVAQLAVCYAKSKRWDDARKSYGRLAPSGHLQSSDKPDKSKPSELWLSTTHELAEAALARRRNSLGQRTFCRAGRRRKSAAVCRSRLERARLVPA